MAHTDTLLRRNRLSRGLTIDEVVQRTRIPRTYIEMIDKGRLADLPAGIYGRSYVRAFAATVGVNADEALACCETQLTNVPDPLPALREIARERTAPTLAAAIEERIREWYAARDRREPFKLPGAVYVAASLDALFLFALNAFIAAIAANACHVSVDILLRVAAPAVILICAFTSVMYFALLAGIGGQTLGMRICGARLHPQRRPLDLRAIAARAAEAALGGSSLLVDWLHAAEMPARRESHI